MLCPCCGQSRPISAMECHQCGARQIGEPLTPPDVLLPRLGLSFTALACVILVVLTFLVAWVFGNDMKVGRVLLVWILGDATTLSKKLLEADSKLPLYRIFSFDAYRLAFPMSFALIPISIMGSWAGWQAMRKAKADPTHFGGFSIAKASVLLSACLLTIFGTVVATSIPEALVRGRAKHVSATSAVMYAMHYEALQKYYREYGSYPQDLTDISRVSAGNTPHDDYWANPLNYSPIGGVIASRGSAPSFSGYKLVSAGEDGKFGTPDDITMIDGIIVDNKPDNDALNVPFAPEKPRP